MEKYKPTPVENIKDVKQMTAYVQQEFQRIANSLEGVVPQELEPLHSEPAKKRDRMLVFADGTNWDPGSGAGIYLWLDGRWNHLAMSPLTPDEEPPEPPPGEEPPPEEEEPPPAGPLPPEQGTAVPTFHCMGLSWTPPANPGELGAKVEYRKQGDSVWKMGPPMWYDARNNECRGSVFWLDPDTTYEFQFSMPTGPAVGSAIGKTWSEVFPEGEVVPLVNGTRNTTLVINSGGTKDAYKVYQPPLGGSTIIDVGNNQPYCIRVQAPFVIIRGLTIRNAQQDLIRLETGAHDVVIEGNDMSNWGRRDAVKSSQLGWDIGINGDGAIHGFNVSNMDRIIVQFNNIHDPRYGSSPWDNGHPRGPNGIIWEESGGNHVIRWNSIHSTNKDPDFKEKFYMDAIGGGQNFSEHGFPGPDSDVYGNYVYGSMDDAIEAEGGGKNVRVWGNYMDMCATGVASTVVARGPTYIFRNVMNRSRFFWRTRTWDTDTRAYFGKAATLSNVGRGMRFVFHNTTLQHAPLPGFNQTMGVGSGMSGLGSSQPLTHTYARNNVWHIWKDHWGAYQTNGGVEQNDFDYDLYNGTVPSGQEANGIRSAPTFAAGHGPDEFPVSGKYQLASGSSGHDSGEVIANINSESFVGVGPDRGAHEEGTPDLVFGHLGSGKGAGEPL